MAVYVIDNNQNYSDHSVTFVEHVHAPEHEALFRELLTHGCGWGSLQFVVDGKSEVVVCAPATLAEYLAGFGNVPDISDEDVVRFGVFLRPCLPAFQALINARAEPCESALRRGEGVGRYEWVHEVRRRGEERIARWAALLTTAPGVRHERRPAD